MNEEIDAMPLKRSTWTEDAGASRAVALEVLRNGPLSRSEVARRLALSPGSLTRLSTPLIQAGLLREVGETSGGRVGRPSQLIDVVPNAQAFAGLKLRDDRVMGVITDLRAQVHKSAERPLTSQEPEAVADSIRELVDELGAEWKHPTAIGIGLGGRLAAHRMVRSAAFLGWDDVPLAELVEQRTGLPTILENDVVAFTEYEHWFGAGRGLSRFAVVTLGAGIGYGLVANDAVVADEDHGIGLVGHWPLDPFGPVCSEGHRGCAKSILTEGAIVTALSGALGRPVTYEEAMDLGEAGEPAARRVLDDAGEGLGRLLAAIANLTMPECIVLGGEGVRLASVAREAVERGIAKDRDPRTRKLDLVIRSGSDTEWCRGAAVLAIQSFVLGARMAA
jgi:predicted NBD/HSP70 family sugar kinase